MDISSSFFLPDVDGIWQFSSILFLAVDLSNPLSMLVIPFFEDPDYLANKSVFEYKRQESAPCAFFGQLLVPALCARAGMDLSKISKEIRNFGGNVARRAGLQI